MPGLRTKFYFRFIFQAFRRRRSAIGAKEVDSLLRRCHGDHFLRCNVRIWPGKCDPLNVIFLNKELHAKIERKCPPQNLAWIFLVMQDNVMGVLSHFISIHYILFCIGFARGRNHEPYAGEFKTFRLDLQQQMVRRHLNHPFPQQKRSLRRENPQIGTNHLFPRIFR